LLTEALGLDSARVISLTGAGGKTSLMFALGREFAAASDRVLLTTTTKISTRESERLGPPLTVSDLATIPAGQLPPPGGIVVACSGHNERGDRALGFSPRAIDEAATTGRFDRIIIEADGSARRPLKAPAPHEPVVPASTDAMISVAGLSGLGESLDEGHLFRSGIWAGITGSAPGEPVTPADLARVIADEAGLSKGLQADAAWTVYLNQADDEQRKSAARDVLAQVAVQPGRRPCRVVSGSLQPDPYIDFVTRLGNRSKPIEQTP